MEPNVSDVFGVNEKIVLSTIERTALITEIDRALRENKHIVIYGASKQGKSYLRKKYIPSDEYVLIDCGPDTTIRDIYTSIARQQDVEIITTRVYGSSQVSSVKAKLKGGVKIPFLATGEAEAGGGIENKKESSEETSPLEFNLNNAQDLCELLKRFNLTKRIVLENFHYLKEKAQETLAFDLRTFSDHGFQFIILGVWRDQNRLTQYNGDLQGRIVEIPVEPWEDHEFEEIARKGETVLNVSFDAELLENIKHECFSSIGIFQELCKRICIENNVLERQPERRIIRDNTLFNNAVQSELKKYGQRHVKSFRAFVTKSKSFKRLGPSVAYYVAKSILQSKFSEIVHGITREHLQKRLSIEFPDGNGPNSAELGQLLHEILRHQSKRSINPPLFDYDEVERLLIVIDSTLFFYLKHNKDRVLADIADAGGS
jgi:hypothetical protein